MLRPLLSLLLGSTLLRHHLLVYGLGGLIVPFVGIKAIDLLLVALHLTGRSS